MSWLKKLFPDRGDSEEVDYYREGLDLLRLGQYHEALTSFRLALRDRPSDVAVLQQIAIAYTRIGMTDEAIKTYRNVLEREPDEVSAHYGLAFLHLRAGDRDAAVRHLEAFLRQPPQDAEAERHVEHARRTLADLAGTTNAEPLEPAERGQTPAEPKQPPAE